MWIMLHICNFSDVYSPDWVQTKSILLTHILYCLLSWLGSDKFDTLDTHTLLFTFLTGFRLNRYSWHTYFIVYFLDWVQTKSILLTHILYWDQVWFPLVLYFQRRRFLKKFTTYDGRRDDDDGRHVMAIQQQKLKKYKFSSTLYI